MSEGTAFMLQGLKQNTLVAGKTTALRLFGDTDVVSKANYIDSTILRPDGSRIAAAWSKTEYVPIKNSSEGPSLVVQILGYLLPWVGTYYVSAKILGANRAILATYTLDRIELLPTKDLRLLISRVWSGFPAKPGEIDAVVPAMRRFAALYPIRDVISTLDGDRSAGLRYNLDNNPMGPPNQDGHLCPLFASWLNRPPGFDSIDRGIAYRFPNAGEGSGGNSNHFCPGQNLPWALIVWGAPLANVFCQETAHSFGMEPPQDPHVDPNFNTVHSKDLVIDQRDAELGFDIQFNQPWPVPTYDVMYPSGPDPEFPDPSHSFNSWDWEYLRQQIVQLPSTGPTGPFISWQNLEGHDLRPYPAVGKNADGRQEVFVLGGDRAIYHRWEISPGGDWSDWASLAGHDLQEPLSVASNADGRLEIYVLGADGRIYHRWQSVPNGAWNDWALLGGAGVRDFSVSRNADGRLEVIAVWSDGALHTIWQTAPNAGWSDWASLGGFNLQGPVALGRNADGRLEAFAVGSDGIVYHKWQTVPSTGPWSDWSSLSHPSLPKIADVAVNSGADGRLYAFLMRTDKSISYRSQRAPNGGWGDPVAIWGHDLLFPCAVGRNPDGRLEVFVIGGDRQLYNTWQIDPARPDSWSSWISLGGRDIQAGIGIGSNRGGELELFVIGSDAKLYRGPRS